MEKREAKTRIGKKIQQRLADGLEQKTEARIKQKGKQHMKEYMRNSNTDDIKDILKIRLHMWNVKKNYPKNEEDTRHPIFRKGRYNRAFARL